ncbi:MAG TPA: DUF2087 domain-containing protein [Candidatus Nanoarchaeia archaeon]|nr:DUF2087 domain-containing protein [Candidatus Nanoarchaeia archaeon]
MTQITFPFDTEKLWEKFVKHHVFPKKDFQKQAILLRLLEEFEDKRIYAENEVNEKLAKHFEDYTFLRRELINFGYMQRNPNTAEYWVVKRTFTHADIEKNPLLKRHAEPYLAKP